MFLDYNKKLKGRSQELRNKSTLGEILLWMEIKNNKLGYTFLRQKPLLHYIADFYCKRLNLAIEIDGSSHEGRELEDNFRQVELENEGVKFLRFTDEEVRQDARKVAEKISLYIKQLESR